MGTDLTYRERTGPAAAGVAIDLRPADTRSSLQELAHFYRSAVIRGLGGPHRPSVRAARRLSARRRSDDGYLFVVFKPQLPADLDEFKQQLGELIERIKATPRRPEVSEIRIPGERAFRSRERALREGIEVDRAVYEALATLHA